MAASSDLLIENNIVQHNTAHLIINDGGSNIRISATTLR